MKPDKEPCMNTNCGMWRVATETGCVLPGSNDTCGKFTTFKPHTAGEWDRAVELLRRLEYPNTGMDERTQYCHTCGMSKAKGHRVECPVGAFLSELEK